MRKATGKVVSLVLALALVITSFSATFASAASTKTEGAINTVDLGDVTLVNLSDVADNSGSLNLAKEANQDKFNLTDWIDEYIATPKTIELETYDHIKVNVTSENIQSVSVSGDSVVRVEKATASSAIVGFSDEGDYVATLRSATVSGNATIKILFTGTTDARNGEEITVRGTATLDVEVKDAKTPYLKDVGNLQKNPAYVSGDLEKNTEGDTIVKGTGSFLLPQRNSTSAEAIEPKDLYVVAYSDTESVKSNGYTAPSGATLTDESPFYVVQVVGSDDYLHITAGGAQSFVYGIANPTVGKSVRVRVYAVKDTDTNTSDEIHKWELGSSVATSTVKVEDKILVNSTTDATKASAGIIVELGNGDKNNTVDGVANKVLSKSKTYVELSSGYWTVNSSTVIDCAGAVTVESGRVGNVFGAAVTVNDGTVGDIEAPGAVVVNGGTIGDIDSDAAVTVDGATVASISAATTVEVKDGKVSGAVSASQSVTVRPANDECTASVGAVKAPSLTIDSTEAAASATSFFASEGSSYALTLIGDAATIGAINADYRALTILLDSFVGTISAPSKANFTGYSETGAELTTDSDDDTNATVTGDVVIQEINLDTGVVTFAGRITVDSVGGNEADFVINAGALYVDESIATGNTLKIADAADVKAGTLVFRAASDIAAVDSFVTYGYELDVVSSASYDGFVIAKTSFAGLTLDCADTIELLVGEEITVTASTYPNGTELPEGLEIMFYLNDADLNYISGNNLGNGQATVKALKYDSEFDVLNTAELVAVVVDEYEMNYEEYGEAKATVKVVEQKTVTETYKSDTTGDVVVPSGNTYQFKITSLNGQAPSVVLGSDGVFELVGTAQEGNDYFFKFQAVGASGAATGVYVNGDAKVATMYVDGNTGYTCDTTTVNVPAGGTYQVKITAASMPTLLPGNSIYTVAFASQEGNDYFFKITATSAQAGDVVGFYINGGARAFVATTV